MKPEVARKPAPARRRIFGLSASALRVVGGGRPIVIHDPVEDAVAATTTDATVTAPA